MDIVPVQSDVMAAAQEHFSHPDDSAFSLTSSACEWMELITCDTAVPVLNTAIRHMNAMPLLQKINMEMVPHFILERCLKMMNC